MNSIGMLKQSCITFESHLIIRVFHLGLSIYCMRINEDTIWYVLKNELILVGSVEVFREMMHMQDSILQAVSSVNMPHMECMTDREEIRIIFYITECFEIGKTFTMFPIPVKKIICRLWTYFPKVT